MDRLFISGRRQDALDQAVADIGGNVAAVQGDVASLSGLDRLYDAVKEQNRNIDVLFASAGIAQMSPLGFVDVARKKGCSRKGCPPSARP